MAWARVSNGYFPVDPCYDSEQSRRGDLFVRWKDIMHEPDAVTRVLWPDIKKTRVCMSMSAPACTVLYTCTCTCSHVRMSSTDVCVFPVTSICTYLCALVDIHALCTCGTSVHPCILLLTFKPLYIASHFHMNKIRCDHFNICVVGRHVHTLTHGTHCLVTKC
jgi:hypothetical protein